MSKRNRAVRLLITRVVATVLLTGLSGGFLAASFSQQPVEWAVKYTGPGRASTQVVVLTDIDPFLAAIGAAFMAAAIMAYHVLIRARRRTHASDEEESRGTR